MFVVQSLTWNSEIRRFDSFFSFLFSGVVELLETYWNMEFLDYKYADINIEHG